MDLDTKKRKYGEYVISEEMTDAGLRFFVNGPAIGGKRVKNRTYESKRKAQIACNDFRKRKAEEERALQVIREAAKKLGAKNVVDALAFFEYHGLSGSDLPLCVNLGSAQIARQSRTFGEACKDFLNHQGWREAESEIKEATIRPIRRRLGRMCEVLGGQRLDTLDWRAYEYILLGLTKMHSEDLITKSEHNKILEALSSLYRWLQKKDMIAKNPIPGIYKFKNLDRPSDSINLPDTSVIRELFGYLETYTGSRLNAPKQSGFLIPYYSCTTFLGIRPEGEMGRADPESMFAVPGYIDISEYMSKTGFRALPIPPNAAAWMEAYPITRESIRPTDLAHEKRVIAKRFGLDQNILRKIFTNAMQVEVRSLDALSELAGNSPEMLKRFYWHHRQEGKMQGLFEIYPQRVAPALDGCAA